MKALYTLVFLVTCSVLTAQNSSTLPAEIQIKSATLAAPEALRDGAMIYGYDQHGELVVLREGTNYLVCLADDPNRKGINISCYSKKLELFMARGRQLTEEGKSEMERREIRRQEAESGELELPDAPSMTYILSGSEEHFDPQTGELKDGRFRYVIYIPYATAESTGLPEKPFAPGMPWIMDPGTHRAHIMITPAE